MTGFRRGVASAYSPLLGRKMTKRDAERLFKENILPGVKAYHEQDGKPDWPARSEAWSFFTDSLNREREITDKQFANWLAPRCCTRQKKRRK